MTNLEVAEKELQVVTNRIDALKAKGRKIPRKLKKKYWKLEILTFNLFNEELNEKGLFVIE